MAILPIQSEYDYSYSGEVFTIRTLPPGFSLATTTASSDYDYSTEDEKEQSKVAASSTAVITTTPAQTTTTIEVAKHNNYNGNYDTKIAPNRGLQ
ncbi:hypothetical protein ANCCAN_18848 [Ancylostoma caninum]|uniref:Uncharacterized protein n=1 Tax=Ancylostoma caninum TaxID=29170 RepID=A0A368FT70_ANCCA|nr:hypothetical protein ANCCAN_18848 [Ancylostoma caninum]